MTYAYFAYGVALDGEHMAEWCREHGYGAPSLEDATPAVLDDHELVLTVPSRYWLGGVGTIVPKPGSVVYGVLFLLPDDQADTIRAKEGVASGLYREVDVEVRNYTPGEGEVTIQLMSASAFAAAEGRAPAMPPVASQRWVETVVRGARAHDLPELWVAELKRKGRSR